MAAHKGHKKEGGRRKGTPNKATKDIKEAYRKLIEENLDNLTAWLKQIAEKDPEKAIRILSDLSEYVIPKLARTDLTTGDEKLPKPININITDPKIGEELRKLLA